MLPVTLGYAVVFARVLQFPPPVRTGKSQISSNVAEKVTKNLNSKFRYTTFLQNRKNKEDVMCDPSVMSHQ